MSPLKPRPRAVSFEDFDAEMKRRGSGGGGPDGQEPDLFRVFREKAQSWRNTAKGLLRPMLPPSSDKVITPELKVFNKIASGGFLGTVTAIHVLAKHRLQKPLCRDI